MILYGVYYVVFFVGLFIFVGYGFFGNWNVNIIICFVKVIYYCKVVLLYGDWFGLNICYWYWFYFIVGD